MNNHNETIFFSPTDEHFTDEEVKGVDKYMTKPIAKGLVRFIDGEYSKVTKAWEYQSAIVMNPTWFNMMSIAHQRSQMMNDTHHIWLERYDVVGYQWILAKELGLYGGKSGQRCEKVALVSLGMGS